MTSRTTTLSMQRRAGQMGQSRAFAVASIGAGTSNISLLGAHKPCLPFTGWNYDERQDTGRMP